MSTYKEVFREIENSKDKRKISNLLNSLIGKKPEEEYISQIIQLTEKVSDIKYSAINLLSDFNSENLEDFFLSKIDNESNKLIITRLIRGLNLNGKEKAFEFLLDYFKKTKSVDIKSQIIQTLRVIYSRNEICVENIERLKKIIGNDYPFFQGYWTKLKQAKKITKENLALECISQLEKNKLNLIYKESEAYDIHISIEKMKKDFIRYINVYCICKNHQSSFSELYTPNEFYISENIQFNDLFEGTKVMRPDEKSMDIIDLLQNNLLPKLLRRVELFEHLGQMKYSDFIKNENEICKTLFGGTSDFMISHLLTQYFDVFRNNNDKSQYSGLVIQKWKNTGRESFAIIDYLEKQKAGNNV